MSRSTRAGPLVLLLVLCSSLLLAACDLSVATPVPPSGAPPQGGIANNPGGAIPVSAPKPAPPPNTYQGCPPTGDGGDPQLNVRKNRTDVASAWYPVSVASILNLTWPKGIERQAHSRWSAADAAAIAQYEGIPVQIEGWLAGAKQQGPESCNCHSADDVDNHLWVVDAPGKSRAQSVVAEVTPRVRALHPGLAFERIRALVDGRTKVRISGWLMMDPEHPDQVGKTRGTIWEIHPIMSIEAQQGSSWLSLDKTRISTIIGDQPTPTEDVTLPPTVSDPLEDMTFPTATAKPRGKVSGGFGSSSGPVQIADISYRGTIKPSEPDEYVEIADTGSQQVNMDGWVLHDIYGGQDFTWHGFTIQPGQKIRVYTNQVHPDTGGFSFGSKGAIWNNKGDAAELMDASGTVVSTFAYGDKRQ